MRSRTPSRRDLSASESITGYFGSASSSCFAIGAFGFGFAQLVFVYVLVKAIRGEGQKVDDKVWEGAHGLEWTLPSPPPHHSFETPPVVR